MSAITDKKCQRLFFALWPDEVVRQELVRLSRQLTVPPEAKRVPPENLHLTLAFIGSQGQEVQECLEQQAAAIDLPPFTLTFDQLGFFAKPQVVWLGDKKSTGIPAATGAGPKWSSNASRGESYRGEMFTAR